jgi:hypothetical protein
MRRPPRQEQKLCACVRLCWRRGEGAEKKCVSKGACVTPSAVKKLLRFSMSPLTIKKFGLFFCASTFPVGKICAKTEKRSVLHF